MIVLQSPFLIVGPVDVTLWFFVTVRASLEELAFHIFNNIIVFLPLLSNVTALGVVRAVRYPARNCDLVLLFGWHRRV